MDELAILSYIKRDIELARHAGKKGVKYSMRDFPEGFPYVVIEELRREKVYYLTATDEMYENCYIWLKWK